MNGLVAVGGDENHMIEQRERTAPAKRASFALVAESVRGTKGRGAPSLRLVDKGGEAARLRIAIVDDHELVRQGLRALLANRPDLTVVADCDAVDGLCSLLEGEGCDILLLDPQADRNALTRLGELSARTKVIVVTASELVQDARAALQQGARAVVLKRFSVETLVEAIRAVAVGQLWIPPALQSYVLQNVREPLNEPLTQREREIVHAVAMGLKNAEVAKRLFISEVTVKTHLNNIFRKLGLRDRVELVIYAARSGHLHL